MTPRAGPLDSPIPGRAPRRRAQRRAKYAAQLSRHLSPADPICRGGPTTGRRSPDRDGRLRRSGAGLSSSPRGRAHCGVRTRNQRFAAMHAFARFVGEHAPELIPWCGEIRAVPFKRYDRPGLCYLEKDEMEALLAAPDQRTDQGRRDYACCCCSTTPAPAPAKPRPSPSAISTCEADGSGSVRLAARAARRDTVRSGRRR